MYQRYWTAYPAVKIPQCTRAYLFALLLQLLHERTDRFDHVVVEVLRNDLVLTSNVVNLLQHAQECLGPREPASEQTTLFIACAVVI